jgi:hypothetical protein
MFKVTLQNSGSEIDCRLVRSEAEIRAAVLDIVSGLAGLFNGDTIVITEVEYRDATTTRMVATS